MFRLRKWYLDVVTDQGTVLIAYAARLRWNRVQLRYASILHSPASEPAIEETRWGGSRELPRLVDDGLVWQHDSLEVCGRWERRSRPIRRRLLDSSEGAITWVCHAPSAYATVRYGDKTFRGIGYAESLSLTIPPWRLPFRELRWGRHASDRHAVVWIEWAGEDRRRYVWLDGFEQLDARLTNAGVTALAGGSDLTVACERDVCHRRALTRVAERLPRLAQKLIGPLEHMVEHKQLGSSSIVVGGRPVDHGWTIFEKVSW